MKTDPTTPKAIFIGTTNLEKVVVNGLKDFNFVAQVPDIDSLWKGLDDGSINNDVSIIITTDLLYDTENERDDFEQLVASMSPHCFLAILAYRPELENRIRESISRSASMQGVDDRQEYYFIDKDNYKKSIKDAMKNYISTTENKEQAEILSQYSDDNKYFVDAQNGRILSAENNYSSTVTIVDNEQETILLTTSYDPETGDLTQQFTNKKKVHEQAA